MTEKSRYENFKIIPKRELLQNNGSGKDREKNQSDVCQFAGIYVTPFDSWSHDHLIRKSD